MSLALLVVMSGLSKAPVTSTLSNTDEGDGFYSPPARLPMRASSHLASGEDSGLFSPPAGDAGADDEPAWERDYDFEDMMGNPNRTPVSNQSGRRGKHINRGKARPKWFDHVLEHLRAELFHPRLVGRAGA